MSETEAERTILARGFLRACRRWRNRPKLADSSGVDLTGGALLTQALVLRQALLRHVLAADERFVGILLPPSVPAAVTNASLTLSGRIAVNLNYTASSEIINHCLAECGIRHIITSRRFLEKFDFKLNAELILLEDFKTQITPRDKLIGAFQAYWPIGLLERQLGLDRLRPDDLLTVIFTSGSTGMPKGVMLSNGNVASNISAIDQVFHLAEDDVLCGILPFFHSLGFTVTLWAMLTLDAKAVYHFTPLEAQQIGKLCHQQGVTILISTPTFLRSYMKRIAPEQFATLDVVVAGAEKLLVDVCDAFEQKFGVRPVEGYGCTELSPLVSVNIPPSRAHKAAQGLKEGTVGRPVPGVQVRAVAPESGATAAPVDNASEATTQAGMLEVKGPNVMLGYLNQPELTAKAMHDGWYVTGDLATLDSEGFITITGRQSRFSKIGGEMVPHGRLEELLQRLIGREELAVAVTAVPDERRGERLLVLHIPIDKTPDELVRGLTAADLPKLWIPSPDSFFEVEAIPVLGTGKLDLQGIRQLAEKQLLAKSKP